MGVGVVIAVGAAVVWLGLSVIVALGVGETIRLADERSAWTAWQREQEKVSS